MQIIKPGDTVMFVEALESGDESLRFVVLEDRGDRLLVQTLDPYWQGSALIPTSVYLRSELKVAE